MPDYFHTSALILTALLLPAFGYLYHRFRNTRTLLWLLGFLFAMGAMLLLYPLDSRACYVGDGPWIKAAGESAFLIGAAMFLASLSPLSFRIGKWRILYVLPYIIPLVLYAVVLYGVYRGHPDPQGRLTLAALGAVSLVAGLFWTAGSRSMPRWVGATACVLLGAAIYWVFFTDGPVLALVSARSVSLLMTAFLVGLVFRRVSPGVVLTVVGFGCWSLNADRILPAVALQPELNQHLLRFILMAKVVAAMGMIVLALEDAVTANEVAGVRERRARLELEAYSGLMLSRRRVDDFDRQGPEICETVTAHSRFRQAALLLYSGGSYRLAGSSGFDAATTKALDELAARLPVTGFLVEGMAPAAVEGSQTVVLDLAPWLLPGDDLKRLGFTRVLAVPMLNRGVTEGALLLARLRPNEPKKLQGAPVGQLRRDDLLAIEMLTARLQATRSQTLIFEKLMDSEKFGHLGHLAASVTQQLNNPLTVILGYASLLDGTAALQPPDRKAVESILTEARHMRGTLASLSRIAHPRSDQTTAVSVSQLLTDLCDLHRPEFLERSIEFRMSLAADLPRVLCSAQQLRQAVRHGLQFAMDAVNGPGAEPDEPRIVRLEAASEGNLVQILIAHSGPRFLSPERAFDPFMPPQNGSASAGVGLSLCATILHDNDGRASAINLEPHGAAIILELNAA